MASKDATTSLKFEFDWLNAEGIAGPELAATWASLRIRVGDSTITRVLDHHSRTIRDVIFVPLYPLAEWLTTNWWFLLHEFENPIKENDAAFDRRHSLSSGREGYGYPDLKIVSSGRLVRLVWKRDDHDWFHHTCLEHGWAWIDRESLHESFARLIDNVIARLHEFDIRDTLLEQEWTAIHEADGEEIAFCKTTAGLGWDPYAINDGQATAILRLGETLDGVALEEAVAAIPLENLSTSIIELRNAVQHAGRNSLGLKSIVPMLHSDPDADQVLTTQCSSKTGGDHVLCPVSPGASNPWQEGHALAQELRRTLELGSKPLSTWRTIARALGESLENMEKATRPKPLGVSFLLEGLTTRNHDENFVFALAAKGEVSRRFLFCRALANLLTAPGKNSVLTRARSWRQQRGRAFAAEFLAPSCALRERISSRIMVEEDIDLLAKEFGVSSFVIQHQIDNHDIAHVWSDGLSQR